MDLSLRNLKDEKASEKWLLSTFFITFANLESLA